MLLTLFTGNFNKSLILLNQGVVVRRIRDKDLKQTYDLKTKDKTHDEFENTQGRNKRLRERR